MNDMKQAKAECNLTKLLLPSVLSMLLCLVLLCGMTWAWFESTQSAPAAPIVSATYRMEVTVENGSGVLQKNSDETYTLAATANTVYTVKLIASGSATSGYCKVVLPNGTSLFTDQIGVGEANAFSFKLKLTKGGKVTFFPQWGTCTQDDATDIKQGNTVADGTIQQ